MEHEEENYEYILLIGIFWFNNVLNLWNKYINCILLWNNLIFFTLKLQKTIL